MVERLIEPGIRDRVGTWTLSTMSIASSGFCRIRFFFQTKNRECFLPRVLCFRRPVYVCGWWVLRWFAGWQLPLFSARRKGHEIDETPHHVLFLATSTGFCYPTFQISQFSAFYLQFEPSPRTRSHFFQRCLLSASEVGNHIHFWIPPGATTAWIWRGKWHLCEPARCLPLLDVYDATSDVFEQEWVERPRSTTENIVDLAEVRQNFSRCGFA